MDRSREGGEYQDGMTLHMEWTPALRQNYVRISTEISMTIFRRDTPAEAEFRTNVRTWLEFHPPVRAAGRTARPPPAEADALVSDAVTPRLDSAALAQNSTAAMGAHLRTKQIIMTEEPGAHRRSADAVAQGLNHIGPILIEFGSDAQNWRDTYRPSSPVR